jgi:hypothetical protein
MKKLAFAAVLCALVPAGAQAADLGDYSGPGDPRGYAYEDPRYSDRYDEPRIAPPPPLPYGYRAPPPPVAGPYAYRPEPRYVEPPRYAEPPRYTEPAPGRYDRSSGCAGKEAIRERLISAGWRDFHDPVVDGPFAYIKARRPYGDLFELRVSRCSGEVVNAQLVGPGRTYGPYAYEDDHRPRGRRPFF